MRIPRRFSLHLKTLTLLAVATLSTLAAAQDDVPGRVGRIALTQGQVSIGNEAGAGTGMSTAQVNWPVTSGTLISTARAARTELRIGSTSIRLDGDSSLEVTQLDDANMRLRLHYGSASVRVLNPDVLAGFALDTPQARVTLQQPGRVRVDAERVRDTSGVEVFEGAALVDGGGSELTLRAGKAAELTDDDVRTMLAQRDAFDDWALSRDRVEDNAASARYVGTDMTGYEDLDRYGNWRTDSEYGPLWTPVVPNTWVPYSDGSWTWLDPWGWTWVDNSPWGYTPFHYGRWVFVNHRWSWAPGRHHDHPVWAPALVGWVGGAGWDITLRDHSRRPASGWYPLTPHDRFVPSYRASENHLRWMNHDVRPDPRRPRDWRPQGLTVVPQDRFAHPGRVDVAHAPRAAVPAQAWTGAAGPSAAPSAPPPPSNRPQRDERFARAGRDRDHGREQEPQRGLDTGRISRDGFIRQETPVFSPPISGQPAQPLGVNSPTPHQPPQALGVTSPTPHQPPQAQGVVSPTPHQMTQPPIETAPPPQLQGAWQGGWQRGERGERGGRREQFEEQRRERQPVQAPPPLAQPAAVAQPVQTAPQAFEGRPERERRGGWERQREMAAQPPAAAPAPAPQPHPQPARIMTAPPAPMPAPAPAAAPQPPRPVASPPQQHNGERAHNDQHGHQQQDR